MSDHFLSHSNSFGFEMGKDVAGCRAFNRNFIVGGGNLHTPMIDQVRKIVNRFLWQGQCREWDAIDKEKRLKTTSMVSRHLV